MKLTAYFLVNKSKGIENVTINKPSVPPGSICFRANIDIDDDAFDKVPTLNLRLGKDHVLSEKNTRSNKSEELDNAEDMSQIEI